MHQLSLYLSYLMVTVLLFVAALCFFTDVLAVYAPGNKKYLLGSILVLYAFVRASRIRKKIIQNKKEKLYE